MTKILGNYCGFPFFVIEYCQEERMGVVTWKNKREILNEYLKTEYPRF